MWYRCTGGGEDVITPTFTETVLANNTGLDSNITLTDTWKNYQILKIVLCLTNDTSDQRTFYVLSSHIQQLVNASLRLSVYFDSGRTQYTISDTSFTRNLTANFTMLTVTGMNVNNCNMIPTLLYSAGSATNTEVSIEDITPFAYDMIFVTLNFTSNDGMPSRSIILPNSHLKEFSSCFVGWMWGYMQQIAITETSMSAAKYFSVTGIKFE